MPFDFSPPEPDLELSALMRLRVRAALAGWRPRPIASPTGWRPLAALRAALRRRRPDKPGRLC